MTELPGHIHNAVCRKLSDQPAHKVKALLILGHTWWGASPVHHFSVTVNNKLNGAGTDIQPGHVSLFVCAVRSQRVISW